MDKKLKLGIKKISKWDTSNSYIKLMDLSTVFYLDINLIYKL